MPIEGTCLLTGAINKEMGMTQKSKH